MTEGGDQDRKISDGVNRTCSVKKCTKDAYYWAEFQNQELPVCPEHSSEVGGGESSSSSGTEGGKTSSGRSPEGSASLQGDEIDGGEPPKTPWDNSRKVVVLNKKLQLAKRKIELAAISEDWSKAEEARDLLHEMIEVESGEHGV